MILSKKNKIKVAVVLAIVSTPALAWWCPPYFNEWVTPVFNSARATLKGLVNSWDRTLQAELKYENERLLSALNVFVKQKALATQDNNNALKNTMQATASAMNMIQKSDQIKEAAYTYGPQFGQGYDPCGVLTTRTVIVGASDESRNAASIRATTEVYAGSGKASDPAVAQEQMIKDHQEKYCTSAQVSSGLCSKEGALSGKNLTFATFLEESKDGGDIYNAKTSFINNIVGLPTRTIPKELGDTPAGQAALMASMEKDSLYSIPISILKEIQMDRTPTGDEVNVGTSPMALMKTEVERYTGNSANYDAWIKVMSTQNEHGALIELLKVKALNLALLSKQYKQQQMMEAGLAAAVASSVKQNQIERSQSGQETASGTNISGAIK